MTVLLTGTQDKNIPISLYNGDRLIAKSSASFDSRGEALVQFSLPDREQIDGKLEINDSGLSYDNTFFFTINKTRAIKVLAITEASTAYLERLFPSDEFDFESTSLAQLNYSAIDSQNLVILDNLPVIPESFLYILK